jgi:hypothetical protein
MPGPRDPRTRIRSWFTRTPDTTSPSRSNPTGDPVIEAAGETTIFPDRTDFLPNPNTDGTDQVPHGVTKWIMRANAQFRNFGAIARREIVELSAGAYARTDAADDQTRRRDELKDTWNQAHSRSAFMHKVLDGLVLHHGIGEPVRYLATWAMLIAGDVAAGTLVLVMMGEHPVFAAIMMLALGAAAVTTGLLGKDMRRRNLWLTRRENLPEDPEEAALVTHVFAVSDNGWLNTFNVIKIAVLGAAALALGTIILRSAVDNAAVGIAFGLWAVAIGAASFWNGWAHLDPAHTAIQNADHTTERAHKAYTSAPTDAIEARAGNLAGIAETLTARRDEAWAAWYTCIAAAAEFCRVNPALAGHGTTGLSYLHDIRPADEHLFDILADEFQIPRYATTRTEFDDTPGTDSDSTEPGSVIDLTAIFGQRDDATDSDIDDEFIDLDDDGDMGEEATGS